jgi:hypothetical protein
MGISYNRAVINAQILGTKGKMMRLLGLFQQAANAFETPQPMSLDRHLIRNPPSIPNDQILASSLHHFFGHHLDLIGRQDMLYLHHETLNQTDITSGDTQNCGNRFLVGEIIGMGGHAMTPTLFQKIARFVIGERLDLLCKPNSRVELWRTHQALIQAGHPQQHEAKLPPIGDITNHL